MIIPFYYAYHLNFPKKKQARKSIMNKARNDKKTALYRAITVLDC